jgi:PAT family beta-lactamase induction signal transducer AmpG
MLFVLCFKLGDALATSLQTPFYKDLGFTNQEIATITKVYGLLAFLAGGFVGGAIVHRLGLMRALWIGGIMQILSNFMFLAQAHVGHNPAFLVFTIGIENFSSGMGGTAFVAYLSGLCNLAFTATQYAILTSLMNVGRTLIASNTGYMVAALGWKGFFAVVPFAGLPGLFFLWRLRKRFQKPSL